MIRVVTVLGTRPEAIKLAPVILCLREHPDFECTVVSTGQHREMLEGTLSTFGIEPDVALEMSRDRDTLSGITAAALLHVDDVLATLGAVDWVLVQGDTTSAAAAALAGFYRGIPIGHIEAGLRSGNLNSPFPEEANRRLVAAICSAHFAPTERSVGALLGEGIDESRIFLTGNTVIDALQFVDSLDLTDTAAAVLRRVGDRRFVLLTAHRRENWSRLDAVFDSVERIVHEHRDVAVVYPVHSNPLVQSKASRLAQIDRVVLTDPLPYRDLVSILGRSSLVLTDSGGLQEEAPALGKPVLVMRDETERPEAVEVGAAKLVGLNASKIFHETSVLLNDPISYNAMAIGVSPYGDGTAAVQTVDALLKLSRTAAAIPAPR